MKKKVSFYTHQDSIDATIPSVRAGISGAWEGPGGSKQHYAQTVQKLEALPRPLKEDDVRRVLKEANFPEGWWKKSFKPVCELCSEPRDYVLVIHEAYCHEYEEDMYVCGQCVAKLSAEFLRYENA